MATIIDDNSIIRREDPPAGGRGATGAFDLNEVLDWLKRDKGQWYVIAENVSPSYVHSSTLVKQLKDEYNCQVISRKVGGRRCVYAKMLPQQQPQQQNGRRNRAA